VTTKLGQCGSLRGANIIHISLSSKTAWVTGGGEGIGRAIALRLADCGARVAVTARDKDELDQVTNQIRQLGGEAISLVADVTKHEDVGAAVSAIIEQWGRLDIVVVNAGANGTWAPIDELSLDEWSATVAVNLTGAYSTIHHAVPHLKTHGGSILIVSSVNGTRMFSNSGATAYAATKAAQLAMGQMLALELAPAKIRVNVLCPGAFDTQIHEKTERHHLDDIGTPVKFPEGEIPLTHGEMGDPVQVANLAAFLASDAALHITGTPVWIDGGQSLLMG
jgi:NAD(P)-dependent dehydrogenase (short-subunit alcohol dehydrogenase family)